ncbi:hypothetical protein IEQ34_010685 [Dendrobium chrysotoxum]|uniref:PITH domain-containing protein n=1 Tax=Dendrobium chrysotoxum TaxID=161865 RepID=A0AAV7GWP8_DENCH|nr:hypothetical protein IEQ34_010685 [Dendrobium chrysotoxum]
MEASFAVWKLPTAPTATTNSPELKGEEAEISAVDAKPSLRRLGRTSPEKEGIGPLGGFGRSPGWVTALNESVAGSIKSVFKAWDRRLDNSEGFLESNEGDPELLVFIPFTSDVKIKSISVVGGAEGTSPSKMRAFINRDGIDFSDAQNMQPVQVNILYCGMGVFYPNLTEAHPFTPFCEGVGTGREFARNPRIPDKIDKVKHLTLK